MIPMDLEQASSLLRALVALASIYVCWWALQAVRFDRFVRQPGSRQAKLLHLVLAVILGRQFAGFIVDYLEWTVFR